MGHGIQDRKEGTPGCGESNEKDKVGKSNTHQWDQKYIKG